MRVKIALGALAAAGVFASQAGAQTGSCAPDDLKCRVAAIEARLGKMEAKPVYVPPPPPTTETIRTVIQCRSNCNEEAMKMCREEGFVSGVVKDWNVPRTGPTLLRSAICSRK